MPIITGGPLEIPRTTGLERSYWPLEKRTCAKGLSAHILSTFDTRAFPSSAVAGYVEGNSLVDPRNAEHAIHVQYPFTVNFFRVTDTPSGVCVTQYVMVREMVKDSKEKVVQLSGENLQTLTDASYGSCRSITKDHKIRHPGR